jgi:hypothetical protein
MIEVDIVGLGKKECPAGELTWGGDPVDRIA